MSVLEAPAKVELNYHDKFNKLIAAAQKHEPATTAIAHPCDQVSLESAVKAAALGLMQPRLEIQMNNGISSGHRWAVCRELTASRVRPAAR